MAKKKVAKGVWSAKDTSLLKKLFATTATAKIAAQIKKNVDAVKKKASRLGLKKSAKYLKTLGR
jgi:hypothetical protein